MSGIINRNAPRASAAERLSRVPPALHKIASQVYSNLPWDSPDITDEERESLIETIDNPEFSRDLKNLDPEARRAILAQHRVEQIAGGNPPDPRKLEDPGKSRPLREKEALQSMAAGEMPTGRQRSHLDVEYTTDPDAIDTTMPSRDALGVRNKVAGPRDTFYPIHPLAPAFDLVSEEDTNGDILDERDILFPMFDKGGVIVATRMSGRDKGKHRTLFLNNGKIYENPTTHQDIARSLNMLKNERIDSPNAIAHARHLQNRLGEYTEWMKDLGYDDAMIEYQQRNIRSQLTKHMNRLTGAKVPAEGAETNAIAALELAKSLGYDTDKATEPMTEDDVKVVRQRAVISNDQAQKLSMRLEEAINRSGGNVTDAVIDVVTDGDLLRGPDGKKVTDPRAALEMLNGIFDRAELSMATRAQLATNAVMARNAMWENNQQVEQAQDLLRLYKNYMDDPPGLWAYFKDRVGASVDNAMEQSAVNADFGEVWKLHVQNDRQFKADLHSRAKAFVESGNGAGLARMIQQDMIVPWLAEKIYTKPDETSPSAPGKGWFTGYLRNVASSAKAGTLQQTHKELFSAIKHTADQASVGFALEHVEARKKMAVDYEKASLRAEMLASEWSSGYFTFDNKRSLSTSVKGSKGGLNMEGMQADVIPGKPKFEEDWDREAQSLAKEFEQFPQLRAKVLNDFEQHHYRSILADITGQSDGTKSVSDTNASMWAKALMEAKERTPAGVLAALYDTAGVRSGDETTAQRVLEDTTFAGVPRLADLKREGLHKKGGIHVRDAQTISPSPVSRTFVAMDTKNRDKLKGEAIALLKSKNMEVTPQSVYSVLDLSGIDMGGISVEEFDK